MAKVNKKTYSVTIEVQYASPTLAKAGEFMSQCDLGIDGLFTIIPVSFETTTKPTEEYVENLKKVLKKGMELGGGRIYDIKVLVSI